ncbi:MAG: hypothetical protein CMQ24_20630, partial [Gammaproteobacteria bacterium]|nr:hypothetical protein [Gammaproteobacteria bacterium]
PNTNERNRSLNRRTTVRLTKEPIVEAIAPEQVADVPASAVETGADQQSAVEAETAAIATVPALDAHASP